MQEGSKEVGGEWWAPPRESIVEKIDRRKRKSRTKVKLALGGLPPNGFTGEGKSGFIRCPVYFYLDLQNNSIL